MHFNAGFTNIWSTVEVLFDTAWCVLWSEMLLPAAFDGSCAPGVHHFLASKVRYVVFVVAANDVK